MWRCGCQKPVRWLNCKLCSNEVSFLSEEAPDGYCSTLPMLPTLCDSHDPAPLPSDYCCHGGENRARHHVGPVPVGGHRGQVSACAAFFFDSAPVGHPVLGVLSAPGVSSRRYLPAGRR